MLAALAAAVSGIAVAFAGEQETEQSTLSGAGATMDSDYDTAAIPRGPYLDYCPTQEQVEAHWDEYGFDYKPLVACKGEEEVGPDEGPPFGLSKEEFDRMLREDGQHELQELVKRERQERNAGQWKRERDEMRSVRWLPDESGQGCGYMGRLPDGRPIHIVPMVCVPGRTAEELIDEVYPRRR